MRSKLKMASLFIVLGAFAWHPFKAVAGEAATGWQSRASILGAAQDFLQTFVGSHHAGRSKIRLGTLDPRLKLKACPVALEASLPQGGRVLGNTTVAVRCPADGGWSIYVTARIDVYGPVLVAKQPLARGSRLEAGQLERVERNLADLPYGYYADAGAVAGMVTKRTIATATVITPSMLQQPRLVKRGQRVSVVAESGPLKIRASGKALGDGRSGDLVRVRTDGSQRVVDGVVVSEGVVKVTL